MPVFQQNEPVSAAIAAISNQPNYFQGYRVDRRPTQKSQFVHAISLDEK